MQTFLYNTLTNKGEGPVREGKYLVDGKPGILPYYLVELEIVKLADPSYDYETQTIEYREYADIENKRWVIEPYTRQLSEQEINARKQSADTISEIIVSPVQFRLSLIRYGFSIDNLYSQIQNIQDDYLKNQMIIWLEYSIEINSTSVYIKKICELLSISNETMNNIFKEAFNIK